MIEKTVARLYSNTVSELGVRNHAARVWYYAELVVFAQARCSANQNCRCRSSAQALRAIHQVGSVSAQAHGPVHRQRRVRCYAHRRRALVAMVYRQHARLVLSS